MGVVLAMCDVVRRGCDVACDVCHDLGGDVATSRRPCAMSLALLPCDVAMSCDVAHPAPRCSQGPEATVPHRTRPERHRNIAPEVREESTCDIAPRPDDIATSPSEGLDTIPKSWIKKTDLAKKILEQK